MSWKEVGKMSEKINTKQLSEIIMNFTIQLSAINELLVKKNICTEEEIQTQINETSEKLLREIQRINSQGQGTNESEVMVSSDI